MENYQQNGVKRAWQAILSYIFAAYLRFSNSAFLSIFFGFFG